MSEEGLSRHVPTKKKITEFDVAMSKIVNSSLADHQKDQQHYELLKRKMKFQEFNIPWTVIQPDDEHEKRKEPEKRNELVKQEPTI